MNVDEEPSIASAFAVRSIPTLVVVHGRKVIATTMGALPKAALVRVLGLDALPASSQA